MILTEESKTIVSESTHWYRTDGTPCYQVPRADGKGLRPTTLRDARKLGLVPSVTGIIRCAAAPQLEAWKRKQLALACLTLPRIEGESADDFMVRAERDAARATPSRALPSTLDPSSPRSDAPAVIPPSACWLWS